MSNYRASHIANFFLDKSKQDSIPVTQMKLMKLVYIGYGWVYAVLDKKLFDEPILAWQHGPVIRSLYDEFKHFGSREINKPAVEFDFDNAELTTPKISDDDSQIQLVLEKVWDVYKRFSASSLRQKTHEAGTPWSTTYDSGVPDLIIDNDKIRNHFTRKITEYLNA